MIVAATFDAGVTSGKLAELTPEFGVIVDEVENPDADISHIGQSHGDSDAIGHSVASFPRFRQGTQCGLARCCQSCDDAVGDLVPIMSAANDKRDHSGKRTVDAHSTQAGADGKQSCSAKLVVGVGIGATAVLASQAVFKVITDKWAGTVARGENDAGTATGTTVLDGENDVGDGEAIGGEQADRCKARVEPNALGPLASSENVSRCAIWKDGNTWYVEGFGESGIFQDMVGFGYIHRLVQSSEPVLLQKLINSEFAMKDEHSFQPKMDRKAIRSSQERVQQLKKDLSDALSCVNESEVVKLSEEIAAIEHELQGSQGLGGKLRNANDPLPKLRSRVDQAMRRAIRKIRECGKTRLSDHLEAAIDCGATRTGHAYYNTLGAKVVWQTEKSQ